MAIAAPSPKLTPSRRVEWWLLLAVLGAAAVRILFFYQSRVTFEDSLISLRYAENLVAGHGMVYNPGERVFGASTPLYVLLLAFLSWLHLPALVAARWLAVLADTATLFLWGRHLWRRMGAPLASLAFALFFGLSPVMVEVGVSGMETSFALLLLSLALLGDLEDRPMLCGAGLGLLILVRPDGLIAAVVLLGLRWLRTKSTPWRIALIAGFIVLPWVLFATAYYGSPIPHSIPAKVAAYNLHRKDAAVNLWGTLAMLAPVDRPYARLAFALVFCPCWLMGLYTAVRSERLRPVAVLFLVWWAYMVVPRTVLFTWYYPLLLMPAYLLGAVGVDAWSRRERWRGWWTGIALTWLGVSLTLYLSFALGQREKLQKEELAVRMAAGIWLRDHTPLDARIAMEPIGYMGYYSGRRILDEVGLVSPEMVPLNRKGDGWFAEMLRRFQPDYVVERPYYLLHNKTLLSDIPMFHTPSEREQFAAEYAPVAHFSSDDRIKGRQWKDYRFVIFRRRSPVEAVAHRIALDALDPAARAVQIEMALTDGMGLKPPAGVTEPPAAR